MCSSSRMGRAFARVACLLMAIMALAVVAPPPAHAADGKATIVIKNDGTYNAEGNFQASFWKIFAATKHPNGLTTYVLQKPFDEFFKSNSKYGCTGLSGTDLDDAAYSYVSGLQGGIGREEQPDKLVEFSAELRKWVREKNLPGSYNSIYSEGDTLTQEVDSGYYLARIRYSSSLNAILINAVEGTVETNIKMEHVPITKEVAKGANPSEEDFGPSVDATFGDVLTYRIKTKVQDPFDHFGNPNYDVGFYVIDGAENSCLRFGKFSSITIGGTSYLGNREALRPYEGAGGLSVEMNPGYLTKHKELIGQEVVITYTAHVKADRGLSGNQVVESAANRNKAYVCAYVAGSGDGATANSPSVHADVYSSRIVIDKFTGEYGQPGSSQLAGAKFELRKGESTSSEPYKFYSKEANVYRIADANAPAESLVTQFTTPDSGQVTLEGLGAGEYWLHEIEPPSGFKKLAKPVKIIVKANYDTDTKALTGWEFSYDMNDGSGEKPAVANKVTPDDGSNVIPVFNKKSQGDPLPDTGGIGVVPFLIVGATIVAGGAYWMRSRMVNDR